MHTHLKPGTGARCWLVVKDRVIVVDVCYPISLVLKHLASVLSSRSGGLTTGRSCYSLDSTADWASLVTLFMSGIKLDGLGLKTWFRANRSSSIRLWAALLSARVILAVIDNEVKRFTFCRRKHCLKRGLTPEERCGRGGILLETVRHLRWASVF